MARPWRVHGASRYRGSRREFSGEVVYGGRGFSSIAFLGNCCEYNRLLSKYPSIH